MTADYELELTMEGTTKELKDKSVNSMQAMSVNDTISIGLKVKNLPSDDDAIANLSFEDAVSAFVVGMKE